MHRVSRTVVLTAFFLLLGSISTGGIPDKPRVGVRIEPSKTWVGVATIHLEVDDLWVSDGELRGYYRVRVPMRPSKNDAGTLHLQLRDSLNQIRESGGLLVGDARSTQKDKTYEVACEVSTDGSIRIDVMTSRRTLQFKSRYETLQASSR